LQVARQVRQFIHRRRLQPGDRLPTHEELSDRLDIGLRRLREGRGIREQHGVIARNRNAGTLVTQPTVQAVADPLESYLAGIGYTAADLIRARAVLESAAAGEAARERTSRDLLVMTDAMEQMQQLQKRGESDESAEEAFHSGILSATHNPLLQVFGTLIGLQLQQNVAKDCLAVAPADPKRVMKEHARILRAIEARQSDEARAAAYEHLIRQMDVLGGCDKT